MGVVGVGTVVSVALPLVVGAVVVGLVVVSIAVGLAENNSDGQAV